MLDSYARAMLCALFAILGLALNTSPSAAAAKETVLYNFSGGNDGGNAATALTLDAQGNLYGTTVIGGTSTCGTVFELSPRSRPPWNETVLHDFGCFADGKSPYGGVTFDASGNLDGTTVAGGSGGSCESDGCGVAFQLTPAGENVLHNFTGGHDGFGPGGAVVIDASGNIFGTTPDGGIHNLGVVYEVSKSGKTWHERVIHTFTGGKDGGVGSLGPLLLDAAGNLYGVTEEGGTYASGTAFKMTRGTGNTWAFRTIFTFRPPPDAVSPYGGLVADARGNLYGTTYFGGGFGFGTLYKLAVTAKGYYHEIVLYSFQGGSDGSYPTTTLIFGKSGALYGTTSMGGGSCDCGTVFSSSPNSGAEKLLHVFGTGSDGAYPYYGLTVAANGDLFGATVAGGTFGQGTVFTVRP